MPHVWRRPGSGLQEGLYSDVQCITGNGHMGTLPVDRMTNGQTGLKTLPSRNIVGGGKKEFLLPPMGSYSFSIVSGNRYLS